MLHRLISEIIRFLQKLGREPFIFKDEKEKLRQEADPLQQQKKTGTLRGTLILDSLVISLRAARRTDRIKVVDLGLTDHQEQERANGQGLGLGGLQGHSGNGDGGQGKIERAKGATIAIDS